MSLFQTVSRVRPLWTDLNAMQLPRLFSVMALLIVFETSAARGVAAPSVAAQTPFETAHAAVPPQFAQALDGRVYMDGYSILGPSEPGWTMIKKDHQEVQFENSVRASDGRVAKWTRMRIWRLPVPWLASSRLIGGDVASGFLELVASDMMLGAKVTEYQRGTVQLGERLLHWHTIKFTKEGNHEAVVSYSFFSQKDWSIYFFVIGSHCPEQLCNGIELEPEPLLQVINSLQVGAGP